MRLKIKGYEVEVKAKYFETRFNKQETMAFLCSLYCDLIEARDRYIEQGYNACADRVQDSMDNIDVLLKENNYTAK